MKLKTLKSSHVQHIRPGTSSSDTKADSHLGEEETFVQQKGGQRSFHHWKA